MLNRLKELRKENNYTLDDIEKLTGINRGTYSNYENGNTEPKLKTWKKLANFFDVPVSYLQGIDIDDYLDKVNFDKLSPLGLFFYENESYDKNDSYEVTEIKLHENMLNAILYNDKNDALKAINSYIDFVSMLKDRIASFDSNKFIEDYLLNVVGEYWWDDSNTELATTNNNFIKEITNRVENGNKELGKYIVKKFIQVPDDILEIYLEYKEKNNEDTTTLKKYLKKRDELTQRDSKIDELDKKLENMKIIQNHK